MFNRYLRKKQTATLSQAHKQPVLADFYGFWNDCFKWRKERNLYPEFAQLLHLHGCEAGVFQGRTCGAANNRLSQRFLGFNNPDAPLQTTGHVESHKYALAFAKDPFVRDSIR